MCLIVTGTFKNQAEGIKLGKKIAKKNIVVWKKVYKDESGYKSAYKGFRYERDTHYRVRNFTFLYKKYIGGLIINRGFHSWKKKPMKLPKQFMTGVIKKFIIPKGATYYEGDYGEYCSNQIICV